MILSELLCAENYKVIQGRLDIEISDVIYDSRKATEGCAFVCLKGYNTDGHTYVESAIKMGAVAIIACDTVEVPENVTLIMVKDTRKTLALMSREYFGHPDEELKTVAVTGTKGKTTTAAMIRSILECGGIKTGTIGTLGIIIGDKIYKTNNTTPESYEVYQAMRKMVEAGCGALVIEASSLGLKWHRVDGILFDIGVFTNFSHDHIGASEHKDLEEYFSCKALLFRQCKHGIFNMDDPMWKKMTEHCTCTVETFGFDKEADFVASDESLIARPGYIGVHFEASGKKNLSLDVAIPGKFSVYNAISAIAVCSHFDIDDKAIIDGLNSVKVKGRVEAVPVPGDYTLLIDYAHNAVSMENVLETLREYKPNRIVTMFGAGGNRPKVRRYEMGEVSGRLSDLSVITEDNSRFENVMDIIEDIKVGIDKTDGKYVVIPNRVDAIRYCMENALPGDIIVLAGKGHEDYQEIKGVKYHMDEREIVAEISESMKNYQHDGKCEYCKDDEPEEE